MRKFCVSACILEIYQDLVQDTGSLEKGARNIRSKQKKQTVENEVRITVAWDLLDEGFITPLEFIRLVNG